MKLNPESNILFSMSEILDIAENKPEVKVYVRDDDNQFESYCISKTEQL